MLNVAQCLGWGTFELVVIADGARTVTHGAGPRWVHVVAAGGTTALTMRPLGMIRVLRRYLTAALVVAVARLAVRPVLLAPWVAGFVTHQLINPGAVGAWAPTWVSIARDVGFTPQPWMSASLLSFTVAALLTLPIAARTRRTSPPAGWAGAPGGRTG